MDEFMDSIFLCLVCWIWSNDGSFHKPNFARTDHSGTCFSSSNHRSDYYNILVPVVGGTGIFQELELPGSVSTALNDSGPPAAMMAITEQLPFGVIFGFLFLLATIIFVLTTTDSMSLTISMAISGNGNPPRWLRAFYALVMGLVAIVLVSIGEGSVNALQSFIVVTAVPVVLLLLTTFWTAPKVCKDMYENQGKKLV